MSQTIEQGLIRFFSPERRPSGVGFLVSEKVAVTCAHVIAAVLRIRPGDPLPKDPLIVDFPFIAPKHEVTVRVGYLNHETDVAQVTLITAPPAEAKPVPLIAEQDLWGHPFRAFGFPVGYDAGVWADGEMQGINADGWLQVVEKGQTGYFLLPGFSGGPVWDEKLQGVVGMVVAADTRPEVRAGFVIPASVFLERTLTKPARPSRIFISYKRNTEPDQRLAAILSQTLLSHGHKVFIDSYIQPGEAWLDRIDREIKASDFLVVLISSASADSEMVQSEVRRAYEYRKLQGYPSTLPVRIAFMGLLPYTIDAFLDPFQFVVWQTDGDNERICRELTTIIEGGSHAQEAADQRIHTVQADNQVVPPDQNIGTIRHFSEDGRGIPEADVFHPPLPEFDPRILDELEVPGGAVKLSDRFYIERSADALFKREMIKKGTITTIRAPRQSGKSSLLVRGVQHARQNGMQVVHLDLQRVEQEQIGKEDLFLRFLADYIVRKLRLDLTVVERVWRSSLGSQDRLTSLMEDYVLPKNQDRVVLALDEADRLLETPYYKDFFAMIRSWHNSRAMDENWNRLNLAMVISTEPYLLINDVAQSPFNVGLKLYLEDFNKAQVCDLNLRHGSPVKPQEISGFINLLGGHPYLTRKAFYTMVTGSLSWAEVAKVSATDQGPFSDHLRQIHWLLHSEPVLLSALKQVIRHEQCVDEMSFYRLLRAGIVKGSGDACACRCDLYRIYLEAKLPC